VQDKTREELLEENGMWISLVHMMCHQWQRERAELEELRVKVRERDDLDELKALNRSWRQK
jgi:hypothetical protein